MNTSNEEKILAKQFWELFIKMSKESDTQLKSIRNEYGLEKSMKLNSAALS